MRITRYDQEFTSSDSSELLRSLAFWHLSHVAESDQSVAVVEAVNRLDYSTLCGLELDYTRISIADARHLRQVLAFFQKRQDLDLGVDRQAIAYEKFKQSETLCLETNRLFRKYAQGGFHFPLDVESVLFTAQRKIAEILGDLPSLEALKLHFGPGATTNVKKKNASARRKLSQVFSCSEDLIPIVADVLAEVPSWVPFGESETVKLSVEIHPGKLSFVPKSAKTDRSIVVEPLLNTFVQLGIGDYMARRLTRFGIDIRDQTRNQSMARRGSLSGALATLDLSSASDTISTGLVESLLPDEWFLFLSRLRTRQIETPDGVVSQEKFSSMGNGFTFPLETLLFYALALACAEGRSESVSVYGDDIIVPVDAVPLLAKTLTCCGFLLNPQKSFWSGPFRESCGKDYLLGIDIRPCYIKGPLSGQSLFVLHNFYVRSGFPEAASMVLEWIDESVRLFGPDLYGDGHLLGDYQPVPHKRSEGWCGYTFETYSFKSPKYIGRLSGDFVFPLYSIYVKELGADPVKDFRLPYRIQRKVPQVWGTDRPDAVYEKGNLRDSLPGVKGYKRIKIYTLRG